MQAPLDIEYRNMEPSEFVSARVRERAGKLERRFDGIVQCRVLIEAPHHRHQRGNLYHIKVVLHVPGAELIINRDPGTNPAHKEIYVAIRDAFDAAERKLTARVDRMRGEVKMHEKPLALARAALS